MSEKNIASAVTYYQAMNNKDLSTLEKYLHPEVQLIGPLANLTGKDAVLNSVKYLLTSLKKLTIRAQFGHGNQVMLAYDIEFLAPIETSRAAVLLNFQEDLIIRYEVFFDARPFG